MLTYRVANNYEEYLEICKESFLGTNNEEPVFFEVGEFLDFFGIYHYRDEKYDDIDDWQTEIKNYNGEMDIRPQEDEYPVMIVSHFDKEFDRCGELTTQIWEWKSLNELGLTQTVQASEKMTNLGLKQTVQESEKMTNLEMAQYLTEKGYDIDLNGEEYNEDLVTILAVELEGYEFVYAENKWRPEQV